MTCVLDIELGYFVSEKNVLHGSVLNEQMRRCKMNVLAEHPQRCAHTEASITEGY